jgi:hypothetical protein
MVVVLLKISLRAGDRLLRRLDWNSLTNNGVLVAVLGGYRSLGWLT